jgi:hypothetical protein
LLVVRKLINYSRLLIALNKNLKVLRGGREVKTSQQDDFAMLAIALLTTIARELHFEIDLLLI